MNCKLSTAILRVGICTACVVAINRDAAASINKAVTVETVGDYTYVGGGLLPQAKQEATDFWNHVGDSSCFVPTTFWTDYNVFDTDFYDPDQSGVSSDGDTNNFDRAGYAISLYSGHGLCDPSEIRLGAGGAILTCNTTSDCPSGSYCIGTPPPSDGTYYCIGYVDQQLVTSSPYSQRGNLVDYSHWGVAWGEDASSGSWGVAGTNGGINLAVLWNSCSVRTPFWNELLQPFAGLHAIANGFVVSYHHNPGTSITSTHDWTADPSRGLNFAAYLTSNMWSPMADSWFATMDASAQTSGTDCPNMLTNYTYGGGHGIHGCGGYVMFSSEASSSLASWHVSSESWVGLSDEANDALGYGHYAANVHCNYDCYTYPWVR